MVSRLLMNLLLPQLKLLPRNKLNLSPDVFLVIISICFSIYKLRMIWDYLYIFTAAAHLIQQLIVFPPVIIKHYQFSSISHLQTIAIHHIYNYLFNPQMLLKFTYQNETHVINLQEATRYSDLEDFIRKTFRKLPSQFTMSYTDEENDNISFMNDTDLENLKSLGLNKIRITISEECAIMQCLDHSSLMNQEKFQTEEIMTLSNGGKVQQIEPEAQISQEETVVPEIGDFVSPGLQIDSEKEDSEMIGDAVEDKQEENEQFSQKDSLQKQHKQDPIQKQEQVHEDIIHQNIRCDSCSLMPILNIRYKCLICQDYDICSECQVKNKHDHPFIKITHPSQQPKKIYATYEDPSGKYDKYLDGLGNWIEDMEFDKKYEKTKQSVGRATNYSLQKMKDLSQCVMKRFIKEENKEYYVNIEGDQFEAGNKKQQKQKGLLQDPEERAIQAGSYLSTILGKQFQPCYKFAMQYSIQKLTKQEILIKYFNNPSAI